jgi:hypothetical protein
MKRIMDVSLRHAVSRAAAISVQAEKRPERERRDNRWLRVCCGIAEEIGLPVVNGQELLHLSRRFEPLHDWLSSPRRRMRIFRPVVQPLVLAVFDPQAHVLARSTIGFELAREPLRATSMSSALDGSVENDAILIEGPLTRRCRTRPHRSRPIDVLPKTSGSLAPPGLWPPDPNLRTALTQAAARLCNGTGFSVLECISLIG